MNKNSKNVSLFSSFTNSIKRFFKAFRKSTSKHKNTLQRIQLTFIYFFAVVVLTFSIQSYIGTFPDLIYKLFPLQQLLNIQFLKIFATPEKTFILYLIILEVLINRSIFKFSLLIKYNVLLIFILEMFQNLLISYWDLLFNREIEFVGGGTPVISQEIAIVFFSLLFLFFLLLYLYCYIRSFQGKFPTFPGPLKPMTDSVAFWLQLKVSDKK
jgi:hypothetical protein